MTALRPIVDFQLAPPPTWAAIPVSAEGGEWPQLVAERLCDEDDVRQRLATALTATHSDLLGPDPHVLAAVWVPDPATGDLQGLLTVDWMLPDAEATLDLAYYRDLIARTSRPQLTVLAQQIEEVTVPAGPALRERERVSRSSGKRFSRRETVFESIIFTVFPPESSDALQLTFSTDALDLGEALAEDAEATLVTLNVLLGEPSATG